MFAHCKIIWQALTKLLIHSLFTILVLVNIPEHKATETSGSKAIVSSSELIGSSSVFLFPLLKIPFTAQHSLNT